MTTAPAVTLDEQAVRDADISHLLAGLLATSGDAVARLSGEELLSGVQGFDRVLSAVTAAQAAWLAALDARVAQDAEHLALAIPPHQQLTEEVALALHVSARTAAARLEFADGLAGLPATTAALAAGRLGVTHARALVDGLTGLEPSPDPDTVGYVERVVTAEAVERGLTPGQVAQRVRRLLLVLDPDGCVDRRQRATRGRCVSYRPDEHGMGWLSAYLPAAAGLACLQTLDAHADRQLGTDPDDARGVEALRADALVNLILTGQADGNPPDDAARPATVVVRLDVTVPISALAGASDEPGDLVGHGPVDASLVRLLAQTPGTVLRRLLTDPVTGLVEVGATTYRPSAGLDRFVRTRDVTCRWPGCRRPSRVCDLDHVLPWPDGPTTASNLLALCRRHHRLKTLGGYEISRVEHDLLVTTPLGRRHSRALRDGWHTPPASEPTRHARRCSTRVRASR